MSNVIDIKSKSPIFGESIKQRLQATVEQKGVDPKDSVEVVTQIEQVICSAMVSVVRNLAEKLASKVFKTLVKQTETPK
jgi:hypothetical protein